MRKFFTFVLLSGFAFYVISFVGNSTTNNCASKGISVGTEILKNFANQTGSANAVTSVVVSYRGLDTLGEVTVLFLSAIALSLLLSAGSNKNKSFLRRSFILEKGISLMLPFITLVGIYVISHGHLSPGGGFPGGVIIATGLFTAIASGLIKINKSIFSVIEGLAGLTFVGLGIMGLTNEPSSFLYNFMPKGIFGNMISAGIIPLVYAVVGVKVASELTTLALNSFTYGEEK